MENVPLFISLIFILTAIFTVWQFYKASRKSVTALSLLLLLTVIQGIMGLSGFYQKTDTLPPRFIFLLGPEIIIILILFLSRKGRDFIDALEIKNLTLLHMVRVPVEITLYYLYLGKLVPILMTFEGYNYDILSGISSPIIYYFTFVNKKISERILLLWNCICLGLLINIVTIAILSGNTPFQKLAFNQPNIGITFFPYVWLPAIIVPLVLLSHLASISQLIINRKNRFKY